MTTITRFPSTDLPIGGVSSRVIVCGDPARTDRIAEHLDGASLLSHKREYRAHSGSYHGTPVTICSHGIGAPGAAIAFEELIVAGGRTLIRVGTCGGLQPDIQAGALIIATAAVQNTGYGRQSAPDGYPAVADPVLVLALQRAATAGGHHARAGIVLSQDSFYPGVAAPGRIDYRVMSQAHVLAVEMECAALFLVGSLRGAKTGSILIADGNVLETPEAMGSYQPDSEIVRDATDTATMCALEVLCSLD